MGNQAEGWLHFPGKDSNPAQGKGNCRAGDRWGSGTGQTAEYGSLQATGQKLGSNGDHRGLIVQIWALQLGCVQDLHVLLPGDQMPKLELH